MKGIYIHIPFCVQKCKYCDFVSFSGRDEMFSRYADALIEEMNEYAGEAADTVFIGGGTPTVLPSKELCRIIDACFKKFNISADCEFSVEANPGTLDDDKIKSLFDSGVNRISVGVQSFNDSELLKIGRIHNAETAYNTICQLSQAGFSNINLDLMSALPNQTLQSLAKTLNTAVSLPVTHISAYSLIIEDGTPLEKEYSKGSLVLPDEDEDRKMYEYTVKLLADNGFKQYEISNFANTGYECRHNKKYWQCGEYIGLGLAAHSYLDGKRFYNTNNLDEYISGKKHSSDVTVLTERDKIGEFMIMGLRMNEGISEAEFFGRFNKMPDELFKTQLDKFENNGFIVRTNGNIALTDKGRNVSNSILCELL